MPEPIELKLPWREIRDQEQFDSLEKILIEGAKPVRFLGGQRVRYVEG